MELNFVFILFNLHVTQKQLSVILGVSEGTVNRWWSNPEKITPFAKKTLLLLQENILLKRKLLDIQNSLIVIDDFKKENIGA